MDQLSRDEMLQEAFRRLEFLKLHPHILSNFMEGVLAKTNDNMAVERLSEEEEKLVADYESQTGNLVYYVIFNDTKFGRLYSFLYVSKCEKDWKIEWDYLNMHTPLVYVLNKDDEMLSESGTIEIENHQGVLVRIG